MTCGFVHLDGPYVLGALPPAERLLFEQHLPGCPGCARSVRELAGLPGLLSRVAVAVVEDPPPEEPVPDTLLPGLLRAVRSTRRRRSLVSLGAAAATVAVAVAGVTLARSGEPDGTVTSGRPSSSASAPAGRAMVPVGGAPVRASLTLASVTWGTRLELACTYAPSGHHYDLPETAKYALVVRTRDGHTEQVGTWRAAEGRTMRVTAATSTARRDIASVEVRTMNGHPVLELAS
jgi:hypothetical protein